MKCGLSHILRCGLLLLLGFSFAQDGLQDGVLQSYGLAVERLNEAVGVLPEDGSLSLAALDQAAQTLRSLSSDATSPSLVTSLERTFARAETAVQNRSATDLSVQVAVLKGGFWRLVYESALRAANEDELALSRERLARVAADMEFEGSSLDALGNADSFAGLITAFDSGAAATVQAYLSEASAVAGDKDATYLALSEAYARFLPVQDSPRVGASATDHFSEAFQTLVNDEPEAFQSSLATLRQTLSDFQEAAGAAALAAQQGAAPPNTRAAPAETDASASTAPSVEPMLAVPAEEGVAQGTTADSTEAGTEGVVTTEAVTAQAVAAEALPAPALSVPLLDTTRADLRSALAAFKLDDTRLEELVDEYSARKFNSIDDATQALYAASSRVLSATQSSDLSLVQTRLGTYRDTFERFLAPLLSPGSTVSADTRRLLAHFEKAPGLRLQDGAVLVAQTDRVARALTGTEPATRNVLVTTSVLWSGWPRLLVMMVLGLLAVVPLYLLNLAFGGANHNWRLVGGALFLLLLPIMYEGLSSLLDLAAKLSGVGVLGSLSAFSIFQNTLSQVVWAVLSALAIALAVAGLYGICVQFGLLGRRSSNETIISSNTGTLGRAATDSAIDWDEEF